MYTFWLADASSKVLPDMGDHGSRPSPVDLRVCSRAGCYPGQRALRKHALHEIFPRWNLGRLPYTLLVYITRRCRATTRLVSWTI